MSSTEYLRIKQTQEMLQKYPLAVEALTWSKDQLNAVRNLRLRKLLKHAKEHSPWYQKQLAHINIDNFTVDHLVEIPCLDKATLMSNWDEIVTDKRLSLALVEQHIEKMKQDGEILYLLDNYHALATSGSSGKRAIYVYNWEEWIDIFLYATRYSSLPHPYQSVLSTPNQKLKHAIVIMKNTVFSAYSFARTFQSTAIEQIHVPVTLPTEEIINQLNKIQPNNVLGTPSTIASLCREPHIRKLKIQPQLIELVGEPLFQPIKKLIQATWPNAWINNRYGASEGIFGRLCHFNKMHLNDDGCIAEPVDIKGNRVGAGVAANKLFLTNLYLYTLPLIRYEFSDQLLFLDETCQCGINHQIILEPPGRPEYDFTYPGSVFVHHLTFVTPLLLEKNIHEYQVIQNENGATIKIKSGGYVDTNSLGKTICNSLSELGLNDPKINFLETSEFEHTATGKLLRFIRLPINKSP